MGRLKLRLSLEDRPGEISLAGKRSPFRTILKEAGGPEWHVRDAGILSLLGVEAPEAHRILVDMKPNHKKEVSLYRLRDVWGYSEISADGEDGWTPLVLRLEGLFVDAPQNNPEIFKQKFIGDLETRNFIYEFLCLNKTTEGGAWTWGRVGFVNGALLWPKALRYFAKVISRQFNEDNLEPLCP